MNKTAIIISLIVVGLLVIAIPAGIYLSTHPQILKSHAQETVNTTGDPNTAGISSNTNTANASTTTAASSTTTTPAVGGACQTPGSVSNVVIDYPYRSGNDLNFTQASCTWDATANAATYSVSVTEVDSNTVVKTDSLSASTTTTVFNVTQNKTYKCDVTAVNSCGQSGGTGTTTLLCKVDGILATATPAPSATPPPVVTSTPAPTPLACGYGPCTGGVSCGAGMTCVTASNGQSYCAMAAYAGACKAGASYGSCCTAPKATPLPTAGDGDSMYLLIVGGLFFTLFGAIMLRVASNHK